MKRCFLTLVFLTLVCATTMQAAFDDDFTGATMRVDYYHAGTATEEHLALDSVRIEGPWPGSRTQLVDLINYGKYTHSRMRSRSS